MGSEGDFSAAGQGDFRPCALIQHQRGGAGPSGISRAFDGNVGSLAGEPMEPLLGAEGSSYDYEPQAAPAADAGRLGHETANIDRVLKPMTVQGGLSSHDSLKVDVGGRLAPGTTFCVLPATWWFTGPLVGVMDGGGLQGRNHKPFSRRASDGPGSRVWLALRVRALAPNTNTARADVMFGGCAARLRGGPSGSIARRQ